MAGSHDWVTGIVPYWISFPIIGFGVLFFVLYSLFFGFVWINFLFLLMGVEVSLLLFWFNFLGGGDVKLLIGFCLFFPVLGLVLIFLCWVWVFVLSSFFRGSFRFTFVLFLNLVFIYFFANVYKWGWGLF